MSMAQEAVQLVPTYGPVANTEEVTALSVPITAFPKSYDYATQWAVGLITAGMMKQAKYQRYAAPFVETFVALKEPYRQYKYKNQLKGANAWLAWFTKFQSPALRRLGRPHVK